MNASCDIEAVDQPEPDEMTRLASFPAQIQAETKDTAEYDRKLYWHALFFLVGKISVSDLSAANWPTV
jgi:hypothetical protein